MNKWKKHINAVALVFGLFFWGGAGITMGVVTMGRMLDINIPVIMLVPDQCDGGPCG